MKVQKKGKNTRQKILDCAGECFAQRGYDGAGVAEICSSAGISKGAFYHHFSSKQQVFLELLHEWLGMLKDHMTAIEQRASSVPEAFMEMAGVVEEVFQTGGSQLHIFLEFLTKAVRDPTVWQATIAPYREYRFFFAGMIERGIQKGEIRSVDPEKIAHLLVSLGVGIVLQGILDPHGARWEKVLKETVGLVVENLYLEKNT